MKLSFTIISLLLFTYTLVPVYTQDSTQTPTAHQQSQINSAQPNHQNKPIETISTTTQAQQNHPNTQIPTPNQANHQNIVTNEAHSTSSTINEQHPANPTASKHQPQETQHDTASVHLQNRQDQLTHQKIHQLLSEMTDQQLKAFEDSLQGDARKYYNQLMQQERKHQQIEQVEYQQEYKQIEHELTKSEKEYAREEEQFNNKRNKFGTEYISYNEYLFELDQGANQDFRFNLATTQQIIFNGYTYQNKEGTYSITQNVQDQQPISIIIYQNNHRIVYQSTFYFKYFGSFTGNENSSYLVRFINPSTHKLVALNIALMFDGHHAADKLTVNDVADHSRRIETFRQDVSNKYTDVSMRSMLQNENRGALIKKLDHYYIYSIVEIVLVLVLCVLQVEFIKKLLSTNNVI